MKSDIKSEIVISGVLIFFILLLLNPFDILMPKPIEMLVIIGLATVFIIFAGFVFKEKAVDERESLHRNIAGRFAYLTGAAVLATGVITESLQHNLDRWLVIALGGMILAKIVGLLYSKLKY